MSETKNTNETQETPDVQKQAKEKIVKIRLPKIRKDQPDEFVGVNGRTWLIKRGVTVEVPECVAEVLQHKEEMLEQIEAYEEQNAREA